MLGILLFALCGSAQDPAETRRIEAAALEWGRTLEREFAEEDPCPSIDPLVDLDAFYERTIRGLGGLEKHVPDLRAFVQAQVIQGATLARLVRGGGSYRLARIRTVDGETRALFRVRIAKGFNLHEWSLALSPKGEIRLVDLRTALEGVPLSELCRREIFQRIGRDADAFAGLEPAQKETVRRALRLNTFFMLAAGGKAEQAFQAFEELPAELKKDKAVLIARCKVARQAGLEPALQTARELQKAHPADLSATFNAFSTFAAAQSRDEILKALEEIQREIGADSFIEAQRGELWYTLGNADEAARAFAKAASLEPAYAGARLALVLLSAAKGRYPETVDHLKFLENDLDLRMDDLGKREGLAGFAKSPEHAEWMKLRRAVGDRAYDLDLHERHAEGQKWEFTTTDWLNRHAVFSSGGKELKNDRDEDAFSFRGVEEILETKKGGPTLMIITFHKAVHRVEGRDVPYPFQGKSIYSRRKEDGTHEYVYEKGGELKGDELEGVRKALSDRKEKEDEPTGNEMFAPKAPVRVGESWGPDIQVMARGFAGGEATIDPAKSSASFTLRRVESRDGHDFGKIDGHVNLRVREMGPMKFEEPVTMSMGIVLDACISGGLPDGRARMDISMQGDCPMPAPGLKEPGRLHLEVTGGGRIVRRTIR